MIKPLRHRLIFRNQPANSLCLAVVGVVAASVASIETGVAQADAVAVVPAGLAFETGGLLPASDFLPANYMQADYHRVLPEAKSDALNLTYSIESPAGYFSVQGTAFARERIREIGAIAKLRDIRKSDVFVSALKKAGASKLKTVGGILEDPIGTVRSLPKGASRFFNSLGESLSGEKSRSEDASYKQFLGASKAKRELAFKLGVDPYSSNETLQAEMDDVAWAAAAGGMVLNVATIAVDGGVGAVLSGINVTESLKQALISKAPADLRILNRNRLQAVAVSEPLITAFLDHPYFSPTHETVITEAIAGLGKIKGNDLFFKQANSSWTEVDARFFVFVAMMLRGYHEKVAPIAELRDYSTLVAALDKEGKLMVPLAADYAMWTERASGRIDAFAASLAEDTTVKGSSIWITGQFSPRFQEEMKTRPVGLQPNALEHLRQLAAGK